MLKQSHSINFVQLAARSTKCQKQNTSESYFSPNLSTQLVEVNLAYLIIYLKMNTVAKGDIS